MHTIWAHPLCPPSRHTTRAADEKDLSATGLLQPGPNRPGGRFLFTPALPPDAGQDMRMFPKGKHNLAMSVMTELVQAPTRVF